MSWEVCGTLYTYNDSGVYGGDSGEIFFGNFNTFSAAFNEFCKMVKDPECNRVWIKVFEDEEDNEGEIMTAYSNEWGDPIFNEDGIF